MTRPSPERVELLVCRFEQARACVPTCRNSLHTFIEAFLASSDEQRTCAAGLLHPGGDLWRSVPAVIDNASDVSHSRARARLPNITRIM